MSAENESLIIHIERYLGKIQRGWNRTPLGNKTDIQVVECLGGVVDQSRAFCTLGLSHHGLTPNVSTGLIRQELLILAPESFPSGNIPAILHQLTSDVLRHHRAFLCGDLIERDNPIFKGRPFYAFVAAVPVLLPDEFATHIDKNGHHIVFAWMVPLAKSEADVVRKYGWSKLEDIFIERKADLVDFDRDTEL